MATLGEMKQGIQGNDDSSLYKSQNTSHGYQQLPQPDSPGEQGIGPQNKGKKKWLICGLVSLLLVIVVIVIIAIEAGGGGKDDGGGPKPVPPGPDPPGPGPDPVVPSGFNPYKVDQSQPIEQTGDRVSGVLFYNKPEKTDEKFESFLKNKDQIISDNGFSRTLNIGVETEDITKAVGVNNDFLQKVDFTFGQADFRRTVLSLQEHGNKDRFEIPEHVVNKQKGDSQYRLSMTNFKFQDTPFSFSFASTRTGETLIDTANQTFVFQDKYIQVDFKIPTAHIFGFGDRLSTFEMGQGAWTMWSQDKEHDVDHGYGGKQLASMHPFCLIKAGQSDEFIGIFFRSSNAQSPIISYNKDGAVLSYITTGGNLDINFFFKGSAKDIIADYQRFIGLPKLPPFWALGWHAASNEWQTLDDIKKLVDSYTETGIALENIWLDGNYMDNHANFFVDETRFAGLKEYATGLKAAGKNLILTLYGGLSNDQPNIYRTLASGALIMNGTQIFDAKTYTEKTVFLDWFNSQSKTVWETGLHDLLKKVPFDGIQLTMNAPTLFCNGGHPNCTTDSQHMSTEQLIQRRKLSSDDSKIDTTWYTSYGSEYQGNQSTYYLPFIPQMFNLDNGTIALNATHYDTTLNKTYMEYDVHALFGHMQAKLTSEILSDKNNSANPYKDQRMLISSTSTFAGTGHYAQTHITGQKRTFEHMKFSIASMMRFNMFGIPYTGADVCGTKRWVSNQTEEEQLEICARWYQLSTFYPMARTNRDKDDGGIMVEPWALKNWTEMATYSIEDRYMYANFVYECLFAASQSGHTCFDPIFYHYPQLDHSFSEIEHSFIINDAIKVSPVLQSLVNETETTIRSFFPMGVWPDLDDNEYINVTKPKGQWINLTPGLGVKKHLRPGYIVPLQYNATAQMPSFANSTIQLAHTQTNLFINRDQNGFAKGKLLFDDGNNQTKIDNGEYQYYEFHLVNRTLEKMTIHEHGSSQTHMKLSRIVIYNAEDLKTVDGACFIGKSTWKAQPMPNPVYDEGNKTLTFTGPSGEIDVYEMQMIQLTSPQDQYNFCDVYSSGWFVDTTSYQPSQLNDSEMLIVLNSSKYEYQMEVALQMGDGSYSDETLQRDSPIINVQVSIIEGDQQVFTVPDNIVDIQDVMKCTKRCKLSEFVDIDTSTNPKTLVTVFSNDTVTGRVPVWSLNAMILDEFVNVFNTEVYTRNKTKDLDEVFYGIMGLTERFGNELFLPNGVYSLWTRDIQPKETGQLSDSSNYNVHPFYMAPARDHTWFGVYHNLADASDWWVENNDTSGLVNLTTFASGGIIDISIMFGNSPNEVTQRYHDLVGRPVLTPMWALGWGQSRRGYNDTKELRNVTMEYEKNLLPLDSLWSDVDYMDELKDFTIDSSHYGDLPDLVTELHNKDIHYVPIVDPGIAQRQGGDYAVYNSGQEKNVFIKAFFNGTDFTGKGVAGDVVFPDFFYEVAVQWWKDQIEAFYQLIKFDGLWLDKNIATNLCDGACYKEQVADLQLKHLLPYTPTGRDLEKNALSLDAWHNDTTIVKQIYEMDAHSLFGTMQAQFTHEWFKENNKRTMIIGKSSFAGMGKFGSKWNGYSESNITYLGSSVTDIMLHNVHGIPLSGADVCGQEGDVNATLCTRWYSIGAYYPFSRNHNGLNYKLQEPYMPMFQERALGRNKYIDFIRTSMQVKMALVNYYYTEISMLHEEGGAFYRPMFFDFPHDDNAFKNQTLNVMLGKHLKLSQQSEADVDFTDFYFPEGEWCPVFNTTALRCIIGPTTVKLSSQMYQTYVHIREGSIVPLQTDIVNKDSHIMRTTELQANPIDIHIHPNFTINVNSTEGLTEFGGFCDASGRFLNDNGTVLNYTTYQNRYDFNFTSRCQINKNASQIMLNITHVAKATNYTDSFVTMNDHLGKIVIYNADASNFQMKSVYWLNVHWNNGTAEPWRLPINATFNADTKQTVFDGGETRGAEADLPLQDIAYIEFNDWEA